MEGKRGERDDKSVYGAAITCSRAVCKKRNRFNRRNFSLSAARPNITFTTR